jgi:hypothetical protein
MFGASALGNTQYQAAAAHRINPLGRGLKSLLPIVAALEHYNYTGYQMILITALIIIFILLLIMV